MSTLLFNKGFNLTGRFYAKGNYDGAPDHTLDSIILSDSSGVITSLSSSEDTKVEFKVTGSPTLPGTVRVIAYRSDNIDNSARFINAVVKGRVLNHVTAAGTGILSGIICNPSVKSQLGTQTTISFHVKQSLIALGQKYYFQVIVNDTVNNLYTTYISGEYTVTEQPPAPIYPDFVSEQLIDYNQSNAGNIRATITERIKSKFTIDRTSYDTKVVAEYGSGSYNTLLTDVKFTISEGATVLYLKNLASGELTRTDAGANTSWEHTVRLKHDESSSWEGKTLTFKWEQVFTYSTALTGKAQDHIDHIYLNQTLLVGSFQVPFSGANDLVNVELFDDQANELVNLCTTAYVLVRVTKNADAGTFNFIAMIDSRLYNSATIEEEETYVDNLPQLASAKLFDVPATFTGNVAEFKVLVSALTYDRQYRVFGLRKQN